MKVLTSDLIAYLQTLPADTEVLLDKDGWMEDDIQPRDVQQLIRQRGVFTKFKRGDTTLLLINN